MFSNPGICASHPEYKEFIKAQGQENTRVVNILIALSTTIIAFPPNSFSTAPPYTPGSVAQLVREGFTFSTLPLQEDLQLWPRLLQKGEK